MQSPLFTYLALFLFFQKISLSCYSHFHHCEYTFAKGNGRFWNTERGWLRARCLPCARHWAKQQYSQPVGGGVLILLLLRMMLTVCWLPGGPTAPWCHLQTAVRWYTGHQTPASWQFLFPFWIPPKGPRSRETLVTQRRLSNESTFSQAFLRNRPSAFRAAVSLR